MSSTRAKGILSGVFLLVAQALEGQSPPALQTMPRNAGYVSNQIEKTSEGIDHDARIVPDWLRQAYKAELNPDFLPESQVALSTASSNITRQAYAGDQACRGCHAEKAESYLHTPHHLTSRLPDEESILGSFAEGKNILRTSNPGLYFRMESRPDGFYQTSMSAIPPVTSIHSERISVVIGSGRVGQMYLYWKDNLLFQLPVSYWTNLGTWVGIAMAPRILTG
jgi:hypothetical protein